MTALWVAAALAKAPWAEGHEMVDALAWAADTKEIRRHLRDARSPTGAWAPSVHESFRRGRAKHRPLVAVEVELFEEAGRRVVHARQAIVYTHRSRTPTDVLELRVFANGAHTFPGSARVLDLRVDGSTAAHVLQETILTVELPQTLRKGDQARVYIDLIEELHAYTASHDLRGATQLTAEDVGGLGYTPNTVHLGGFLPLIAPFHDGSFDTRPLPKNGEYAVFDPVNIFARVDVPAHYTVATTGVTQRLIAGAERQTLEAVAADSRDFVVAMGRDLAVQEVEVGGTRLRIWSPADEALMGRHITRWATLAFETLTKAYGPLSIRELDIVEAPLYIALGQEFPGLVLVDLHHKDGPYFRDDLHPWTVTHEIAHQWWSMEVGSDARDVPWLDEALASHGSAIVARATDGPEAVELRYEQDIRLPLAELGRANASSLAANLPGESYDIYQYSAIVYGRAALFVDAVQQAMGEEAFAKAMQRYLKAHRGSIATPEDLLQEWRKQASDPQTIDALYRSMIEGTSDVVPSKAE